MTRLLITLTVATTGALFALYAGDNADAHLSISEMVTHILMPVMFVSMGETNDSAAPLPLRPLPRRCDVQAEEIAAKRQRDATATQQGEV